MGGRRGPRMVALAAVGSLAGCATGGRPVPIPEGWAPTLLVESAWVEHVAVRVNGSRIGTVTRGRNCLRISAMSGTLTLDFVAPGGRARLPEPLLLMPGRHWRLELGPDGRLARDVLSLGPAEHGCSLGS